MSGRIVVGVDGSEGSLRALQWAIEDAGFRDAAVQAVTVWRGTEIDDDMALEWATLPSLARLDRASAEQAGQRLRQAVAEVLADRPVRVDPIVVEGDPAEALCRRAAGADLLAVGSRGHGVVAGLLIGSVSLKCARHSPCPVAIVAVDQETAAPATRAR